MYTYAAKLLRVIDGDTAEFDIDLGFDLHYIAKVRLAGINAPEMKTAAGPAAKARLTELLTGTLVIKTTLNKEFEKYGRVLGVIYGSHSSSFAQGNVEFSINQQMITEGFAVAAKY